MPKSLRFIEAAMRQRQISFTITGVLLAIGIFSFFTMPKSENPRITNRQALIMAFLPGANELQVESQITDKLERYLFTFPEVNKSKTTSVTKAGTVFVTVDLQEWVKEPQLFYSKLQQSMDQFLKRDLPTTCIGPSVNNNFGDVATHIITISVPDAISYDNLTRYLDHIEDKLKVIPVISTIKRYGEQNNEVKISISDAVINQLPFDINYLAGILSLQNVTMYTGSIKSPNSTMPVFSPNRYKNEHDVGEQIVYSDSNGDVIKLKDIAKVERRVVQPTSYIKTEGNKTAVISIEIQPGQNVVKFGKQLEQVFLALHKELPDFVEIDTIVDSSKFVKSTIDHFMVEFYMAVISVIVVIMILLPFRIALVAGVVAPITLVITFGVLNALGIELHQVTLAALIIVLGIIVDDALVVVDHFVELRSRGKDSWNAAWMAAQELFVPILTATIVIAFAFIPLSLFLAGLAGQFIAPLPATVAIALLISMLVALFLTPLMCYLFIPEKKFDEQRKNMVLDKIQIIYNRALALSFRYPKLTMTTGLLSVILAGILGLEVPQELFPTSDINQFNAEIWMREGTNLQATSAAVSKVESILRKDNRVKHIATFYGTSAPRFHTTYSPEPPRENFAQIFITTNSIQSTKDMCKEYVRIFSKFLPDGDVRIRELSFNQTVAPVEFRVYGADIEHQRSTAQQIKKILNNIHGTNWVRDDYGEPYLAYNLKINPITSAELGLTNESINRSIAVATNGFPIGYLWEGNKPTAINMKLDSAERLTDIHINNVRGQKIRLNQVATMQSEWHDVIRHRNGIRCLTVLSEAQLGIKANNIISIAGAQIDTLKVPPGIRIEYAGEAEALRENIPGMAKALGASLALIFITLLFQFKNIIHVGIILTTFPLSLLGAMLGLLITGNPAGFTAFMGIISLTGVVVRNGIILVDLANHLVENGNSPGQAAFAAGKRRMRPIVLTSFAAAIGVIPMVLSNSSLWSPLGSVLAFGLIISMTMTLFVIPVMYATFIKIPITIPSTQILSV